MKNNFSLLVPPNGNLALYDIAFTSYYICNKKGLNTNWAFIMPNNSPHLKYSNYIESIEFKGKEVLVDATFSQAYK